jgi:hypothetical protein
MLIDAAGACGGDDMETYAADKIIACTPAISSMGSALSFSTLASPPYLQRQVYSASESSRDPLIAVDILCGEPHRAGSHLIGC